MPPRAITSPLPPPLDDCAWGAGGKCTGGMATGGGAIGGAIGGDMGAGVWAGDGEAGTGVPNALKSGAAAIAAVPRVPSSEAGASTTVMPPPWDSSA